jgi:uncharacterized membrane protein SpoIIM required for sporulation
VRELNPDRFLSLYRMCCEHLVLSQARGFPEHIRERLASITSRAHQSIYGRTEFGLARVADLLLWQFPSMVRRHWIYVAVAAACLMVPTLALGIAVYLHPDLILTIVDRSTAASYEQMYSPAAQAIGRARDVDSNWLMFGFYIKNNVGIAFQCYATGILFGVGCLFYLLYNGAFGGGIAGFITARGYGETFYSFVATHSAFELTAIVLSGAAGLRLGKAMLLPGRQTRVEALRSAARETSVIIVGVAVMLLIAAVIEAFWSSAPWISPAGKYAGAAVCWSLVLFFFLRRPRAG